MLMPRKVWEILWENCSSGRAPALTLPRQMIPLANPSLTGVGAMSSRTKTSYGLFSERAAYSHPVICLRPPSM